MTPGMKQREDLQAEVVRIIGARMLPPDDVVDLMGKNRRLLGEAAVFALVVGATLDELAYLSRNLHEAARMLLNSSA